jgi:hypothetical protein
MSWRKFQVPVLFVHSIKRATGTREINQKIMVRKD